MKRALTVSTALAVLVTVGCSSDGPDQTTRSTDSRPTPSTLATATDRTDPTATTDPTDPTTDPTDPTDPTSTDPSRTGPFGFARLSFFGDCDGVAHLHAARGPRAGHRMGPRRWRLLRPGCARRHGRGRGLGRRTARTSRRQRRRPPRQGVDYSGTNTQEVGVDEGDIVETDGSYVYVAGQDGLRIVSVADAAVVASPELPGRRAPDDPRRQPPARRHPGLHHRRGHGRLGVRRQRPDEPGAAAPLAPRGSPRGVTCEPTARSAWCCRARSPPGCRSSTPTSSGSTRIARSSATSRSSTSRRCRIGCRVGSTRPATGRSDRWRSRSTAPTSPPPVTSRVSASRGSPRSTSTARRRPRVRPASCRPARRCTPRRPASTSPPSRGTGTGRSSRAARPPTRTRRHPP